MCLLGVLSFNSVSLSLYALCILAVMSPGCCGFIV